MVSSHAVVEGLAHCPTPGVNAEGEPGLASFLFILFVCFSGKKKTNCRQALVNATGSSPPPFVTGLFPRSFCPPTLPPPNPF